MAIVNEIVSSLIGWCGLSVDRTKAIFRPEVLTTESGNPFQFESGFFWSSTHFATQALAVSASIPAVAAIITTLGYAAAGDGGGASYKRVDAEPAHELKIQSDDGQWWEIDEKILNPAMRGAKFDGTTDDTLAAQEVLDAAEIMGGREVRCSPGVMYTTYSLLIGDKVAFKGQCTTIKFYPAQTDATAIVTKSHDNVAVTEHFLIEGFCIETHPTKGNGIGIAGASHGIVRACYGTQVHWHLIDCAGSSWITIIDCYRDGGSNSACQIDNLTGAGGLRLEDADGNLIDAVVSPPRYSHHITVRNFQARDVANYAIHLHRSGGYEITIDGGMSHNCVAGVYADNGSEWLGITIKGFRVSNDNDPASSSVKGIDLNCKTRDVVIQGCTIDRVAEGISVQQQNSTQTVVQTGIVISGNVIRRATIRGVIVDWCSGTISGNTVTDVGYLLDSGTFTSANVKTSETAIGISIWRSAAMTVVVNTITDTKGCAISIRHDSATVAVNDNILRNYAVGIRKDSTASTRIDVKGNTLYSGTFSYWAIYLINVTGGKVSSNSIYNHGTGSGGTAVAIAADGGGDLSFENNSCEGAANATYGISAFGNAGVYFNGNKFSGTFSIAEIAIRDVTSSARGDIGRATLLHDSTVTDTLIRRVSSAAPTTGVWAVGSYSEKTGPVAGGIIGWVCTTAGNPGTWTPVYAPITGSKTQDWADLASGAEQTTTVTVAGAALGDLVTGLSMSVSLAGTKLFGYVSATDTVTVIQRNDTGSNVNLGSGTLRARVEKQAA